MRKTKLLCIALAFFMAAPTTAFASDLSGDQTKDPTGTEKASDSYEWLQENLKNSSYGDFDTGKFQLASDYLKDSDISEQYQQLVENFEKNGWGAKQQLDFSTKLENSETLFEQFDRTFSGSGVSTTLEPASIDKESLKEGWMSQGLQEKQTMYANFLSASAENEASFSANISTFENAYQSLSASKKVFDASLTLEQLGSKLDSASLDVDFQKFMDEHKLTDLTQAGVFDTVNEQSTLHLSPITQEVARSLNGTTNLQYEGLNPETGEWETKEIPSQTADLDGALSAASAYSSYSSSLPEIGQSDKQSGFEDAEVNYHTMLEQIKGMQSSGLDPKAADKREAERLEEAYEENASMYDGTWVPTDSAPEFLKEGLSAINLGDKNAFERLKDIEEFMINCGGKPLIGESSKENLNNVMRIWTDTTDRVIEFFKP